MTDKAYTTADLVIFGVHPYFLRFFYDLPRNLNTCITYFHSRIVDEQAGGTVETAGSEVAELATAAVRRPAAEMNARFHALAAVGPQSAACAHPSDGPSLCGGRQRPLAAPQT
ncbi:hypothetical protein [Nocardia sp. MW-W600-9]